jgi:hypothetical protein
LKRLDQKREKIEQKARVLREVEKLRFSDKESNLMREIYKIKDKQKKLINKEVSDRERVKKENSDKQKAIENQMEINRIVQQQTQAIRF